MASADLQVPLGTAPNPVAAAVARRAEPKKKAAPPVKPLPSRGLLRQVGVARRGSGPPILPRADGTIAPEFQAPAPLPEPEPAAALTVKARLGKLLAPQTDVYRLPDPRSQWVGKLKAGTQVAIVSQWQGWYSVVMGDGSYAYVPQTHVEVLPFEVRTVAPNVPAPQPAPAPTLVQASSTISQGSGHPVLDEAYRYLGTPYVWGGNTDSGIDCSGLVKNCFSALGYRLPRRASEQAQIGQDVPLDQLQPGDRLYFSVKKPNDHTGIYIGNGQFIHAGRGRGNVGVDSLSQRLYRTTLTSAKR